MLATLLQRVVRFALLVAGFPNRRSVLDNRRLMKSPNDESRRYPKPVEGYTATYRQKLEAANALETLIIPVFKQIAA